MRDHDGVVEWFMDNQNETCETVAESADTVINVLNADDLEKMKSPRREDDDDSRERGRRRGGRHHGKRHGKKGNLLKKVGSNSTFIMLS